jgi:hypothetical protein
MQRSHHIGATFGYLNRITAGDVHIQSKFERGRATVRLCDGMQAAASNNIQVTHGEYRLKRRKHIYK